MTESQPEIPGTCPNCGRVFDPSRKTYCDKCGKRFPWAGGETTSTERTTGDTDGIRIAVALVGALIFAFAGWQMVTLQSISGDSVAEAFYNDVGWFSFGMALLTLVVGLPRSSR